MELIKKIEGIRHADSGNFFLLAGPCVVESEAIMMQVAETVLKITDKLKIPYIFKASYRKANRSRIDSFTGLGDEKALKLLGKVRETFHVPVVTDIHTAEEASMAAAYADVLQIPAFLCRQTDLLVAAARTGRFVNIKKGQFLSPEAMQFAIRKVVESGNEKVMITERGTTFGYQDLIVDYRGIPAMKSYRQTRGARYYPLPSATQPVERCHRRQTRSDRDDRQGWDCDRRRRYLHRNPPRPFKSAFRRRQYAEYQKS